MEFFTDQTFLLLIGAGLIAGIVDSIAGGGGLITVPALMLAGIPPAQTLGTNKLQGLFGSLSATLAYARAGHVHIKKQFKWAIFAFLGAVLGALVALSLPKDVLTAILPLLLIAVAVYFAFKPNITNVDREERISPALFGFTIPPLIGFYDGIFGPGAGSFYMLAFVGLIGYGLLKATAHTKLLNFASNLGGFAVFAYEGVIFWKIGIAMGIAQFIGAQIGARLAMKIGTKLIKPLLVIICIALAIKLLWDPHNPIREFLHF